MVHTKTFVNKDDLKLNSTAVSAIILLSAAFPAKHGKYWLTVAEIREWLVRCGVDSSLQMDDVNNATRNHNKNGLLNKRKEKSTAYFRSSNYEMESPREQRAKHNKIPMPKKNFFRKNSADANVQQLLKDLNGELERIKELKNGIDRGEMCCELFVLKLSFSHASSCVILILMLCSFYIIFSGSRCRNINRPVCRMQL